MNTYWFDWVGATRTANDLREWAAQLTAGVDAREIWQAFMERRDDAVIELTNRFDATEQGISSLRVDPGEATRALATLDPSLRQALEMAAANIRTVAEAQLTEPARIDLPQGQTATVLEVPLGAAGIYAPGGRAAYPSSVLMCAIPARVAGVERLALASPPGPDGQVNPLVLAAAALCGIEEIYSMGGAQAIFALAYGTETVLSVDVIAGPGNAWVREAKRAVSGLVAIDSLAGPSELMLIGGPETNIQWAAMDLCAQAEHGPESPLVAVALDGRWLEQLAAAVDDLAVSRPSVADARLGLVEAPDLAAAIDLANAYAPEHLELLDATAATLSDQVRTAGCVFVGEGSATAFGDYIAGSNHVLPTGGAGRFSGPLGPGTFRRRISNVEVPASAAALLAPQADILARAEGLPVHGESAMIRR